MSTLNVTGGAFVSRRGFGGAVATARTISTVRAPCCRNRDAGFAEVTRARHPLPACRVARSRRARNLRTVIPPYLPDLLSVECKVFAGAGGGLTVPGAGVHCEEGCSDAGDGYPGARSGCVHWRVPEVADETREAGGAATQRACCTWKHGHSRRLQVDRLGGIPTRPLRSRALPPKVPPRRSATRSPGGGTA
jgi:hypothetical protein